jgi:hypothetical protein
MAVIYFPPFQLVKGTKIVYERTNGVNILQLSFSRKLRSFYKTRMFRYVIKLIIPHISMTLGLKVLTLINIEINNKHYIGRLS